MPSLTLNGLTIRITAFSENTVNIGARTDSINGRRRNGVLARKRSWSAAGNLVNKPTMDALRCWIAGEGHSWSFEDDGESDTNAGLYSSTGIGPQAGGGTYSRDATQHKFGASSLLVSSGSTCSYFIGAQAKSVPFTIALWKLVSSTWTHYAITHDGEGNFTQYKSGSVHTPSGSDDIELWLDINTGTGVVGLKGKNIAGTNAAANYDDLRFIPQVITAGMISALADNARTTAYPDYPAVQISGDSVDGETVNVCAYIEELTYAGPLGRATGRTYDEARYTVTMVEEVAR